MKMPRFINVWPSGLYSHQCCQCQDCGEVVIGVAGITEHVCEVQPELTLDDTSPVPCDFNWWSHSTVPAILE